MTRRPGRNHEATGGGRPAWRDNTTCIPTRSRRGGCRFSPGVGAAFGTGAEEASGPALGVRRCTRGPGSRCWRKIPWKPRPGRPVRSGSRRAIVARDDGPSVARRAKVPGSGRGSASDRARPASDADLAPMRRTSESRPGHPFAGSRMPKGLPGAEGHDAGRRRVAALIKRMGIEALHRPPLAMSSTRWRTRLAVEARAGARDPPLPSARAGDRPARPCPGDGPRLRPDGPGLRPSCGGDRPGQPPRPGPAGVDRDDGGTRTSSPRRRLRPGTARRTFATPTGAASPPARRFTRQAWRSAGTARARGAATSSSSGPCGLT
jgi:hypothetical protein